MRLPKQMELRQSSGRESHRDGLKESDDQSKRESNGETDSETNSLKSTKSTIAASSGWPLRESPQQLNLFPSII